MQLKTGKGRNRHRRNLGAVRRLSLQRLERRYLLAAGATAGGMQSSTIAAASGSDNSHDSAGFAISVDKATVNESTGPGAARLSITRLGDTTRSLAVTLSSVDETELYVPPSVHFAAGAATVVLDIGTQNDFEVDGTQSGTILVSAEGYLGSSVSIDVLDDDTTSRRTIGGRFSGILPTGEYLATFDVEVPGGMSWSIEPSTTIRFDLGTALLVHGTLIADGDADHEIVFTSAQSPTIPGDWAGIRFRGQSDPPSVMDHVDVSYAKIALGFGGSRPQVTIENSDIHHNLRWSQGVGADGEPGFDPGDLGMSSNLNRKNGPGGAALPTVSIDDAQVIEGHAGTTVLSFDVTLGQVPDSTVGVDVTVANASASALVVERVASGLDSPVFVTAAPGQPDLLFIVEKTGAIKILDLPTGTVRATPVLTLPASDLISSGERGLLGLAFHPNYETNRLFYIYMSSVIGGGDTRIRQYQMNADGVTADPASLTPVLGFAQPAGNHNGGWIGFGPDGYLYIASGDGGSSNDFFENGQDITDSLLGTILRIDVNGDDFPTDADRNYSIPATNPFVGITGDDEIWAYGLRNPWRSSFDRETGDLYIADVGQNSREEINVQPADSQGGENYGWRLREGTIATPVVGGPKPPGAIDPIFEYTHGIGFSVTGGYVYRGPIAELHGNYFFADYVRNRIWSLRYNGDQPSAFDGTNFEDLTEWTTLLTPDAGTINSISSFGEDAVGNLYIVDIGGEVFRISQGADYLTTTDRLMFVGNETSQTFEVEVLGDRLPEPNQTFIVTLSNPTGATIGDGQATGTILNDDPPTVSRVEINGGDPQRSVVDTVAVTFDSIVEIDEVVGDAFAIRNLDTLETINHTKSVSDASGQTVVTFGFLVGPSVEPRGAKPATLAAGNYELVVDGSRVHLEGIALDGDEDGSAGGDHLFVDTFFRKFGDLNGNDSVDLLDFAAFRRTFGKAEGDADYLDSVDSNANDLIDLLDFTEFRRGFGK